ncbi:FtsX-like permease family protein [Sanguibacter sp. 25GB23B1]|uniref:ABC transporter permease n=1 Tax=unclassified Sanguibacter TaxID=2645534 RepID=UPI0032AFE8AF
MKNAVRELRADPRQHVPSVLVVTIASLLGVVIIDGVAILTAWLKQSDAVSSSGTALLMLAIVGVVFFAIALFVSALVISNTFGIIVAGRSERIALLRLVGASSRRLRRSVSVEGAVVGVLGTVAGALVGLVIAVGTVAVLRTVGDAPGLSANLLGPWMVAPLVSTIVVTWAAAYAGSRKILTVSPMEATGQAREPSVEEGRAHRGKHVGSILCAVLGTLLIVAGVVVGQRSPLGLLVALPGGMLSFLGLSLGSAWVMPPVQRIVGQAIGRGPAGRMAARNAARYPARTARTTMGLVIGVTLIVMFATAAVNVTDAMARAGAASGEPPEVTAELASVVADAVTFLSVLVGFSVVIAVVGVVNNLSLSVLQRTREIGLLRAVGLSRSRVRGTIRAEAAQLTVAATALGSVLGVVYGWAGSMSLLSAVRGVGFFPPVVPWAVLGATVVVAAGVVLAASLVPARRATEISPTTALVAI